MFSPHQPITHIEEHEELLRDVPEKYLAVTVVVSKGAADLFIRHSRRDELIEHLKLVVGLGAVFYLVFAPDTDIAGVQVYPAVVTALQSHTPVFGLPGLIRAFSLHQCAVGEA